jgi:signal transduction histidine kinase
MLESVMREIVTNALKHASPSRIKVEVAANATHLHASILNDGKITDPLTWQDGYGLRNLRGRLEELGGSLNISAAENGVQLAIEAPLI